MIPIANNEMGSSVRAKLNKIISLVTESLVVKTADETRGIPAADDYDMLVLVEANQSYLIKYWLVFDLGTPVVASLSVTWTIPSITGNAHWCVQHTADAVNPDVYYVAGGVLPSYVPTGVVNTNFIEGWLRLTPSVDGYVILNWGQNVAGGPILKAGSWIQAIQTTFAQS